LEERACQAESDEFKAAAFALDKVNKELDRLARQIAVKTEAMEDESDKATLQVFARQIAKAEAQVAELTSERETLAN
jgi:DNA-binding ferritin-like protein